MNKIALDNKGFVLAETLVVTVFLSIIFTMIYQNFYPLIGEYEKRENYNDVDGTYSVYWLKNLIEDGSYIISNQEKMTFFENNGYIRFECKDISNPSKKNLCIKLVKEYEINGCDNDGNHCDIFLTTYRIGYSSEDTSEDETVTTSNFKGTVNNSNIMKYEEGCLEGECLKKFCDSFTGIDNCEDKYKKTKLFDSRFKDYIKSLPDYSTESLNEADARVIAAFHHTKDNNNYYSYATIEVDRKLGDIKATPYKNKYILTYHCNNGTGFTSQQLFVEGQEQALTPLDCTKAGYFIDHWNEKADGSGKKRYQADQSIKLTDDKALYAKWYITKPATPSITNPTNGNWVNNNFALTVKTNTPQEIIGYWYYSYNNSNFTRYDESNGKKTYVTPDFSAERNQDVYIRVCNKKASGPNDNENCSNSATTRIRIDKTAPVLLDNQWNWIRLGLTRNNVVVDVTANWTWYDPIPASNTDPSGINWIYQRYAAHPSCDRVPDNPNNEAYAGGNDCDWPTCCNQKFFSNQYLQRWDYESWGRSGWYHLQAQDKANNTSKVYDSYVFHENRDK